jgi:hypothetical protein
LPGPTHERASNGLASIGEQQVRPEALLEVVEEVEKGSPLFLAARLAWLGVGGHEGMDGDAVANPVVEGAVAVQDLSGSELERQSLRTQGLLPAGLALEIQLRPTQHRALPAVGGQHLQQFTGREGSPAGRIEVAVIRAKEHPRAAG